MVWLHGGGNSYGTSSDYHPVRLAVGGDVVVVTVNYRLGVFGNFSHPALGGSGAFGVEDQQAALRWVRRNAVAFGGDPHNVTLFGESGGAVDVCAQLTSPGAGGLFHRAVLQSGTCSMSWPLHGIMENVPAGSPWVSKAEADAKGRELAARVGCAEPAGLASCLRRTEPHLVQPPNEATSSTPVVHGSAVLPDRPDRALAAGRFHRVPVLSGRTRDEGRFGVGFAKPIDEPKYQSLLAEAFGDRAPLVATRYPSGVYGSPGLALAAMSTDRVYSCPQLTDERHFARRVPTYAYEFADRQAPPFPMEFSIPLGAYHTAEIPYLFDGPGGVAAPLSPDQRALAAAMISYWARFARTGDPNDHGLPVWPRTRDAVVQSLATGPGGIAPVTLTDEHHCGFWAGLS